MKAYQHTPEPDALTISQLCTWAREEHDDPRVRELLSLDGAGEQISVGRRADGSWIFLLLDPTTGAELLIATSVQPPAESN